MTAVFAIALSAFYIGVIVGVFCCALGAASKRGEQNNVRDIR